MNGRSALDRFLQTDPRDAGCAETMQRLHVYAELILAQGRPEHRYRGLAATRACDPCAADLKGLLAAMRGEGGATPSRAR